MVVYWPLTCALCREKRTKSTLISLIAKAWYACSMWSPSWRSLNPKKLVFFRPIEISSGRPKLPTVSHTPTHLIERRQNDQSNVLANFQLLTWPWICPFRKKRVCGLSNRGYAREPVTPPFSFFLNLIRDACSEFAHTKRGQDRRLTILIPTHSQLLVIDKNTGEIVHILAI